MTQKLSKLLQKTQTSVEIAYKGYEGLKGVTHSIEIKDGKVVQHIN